MLSMLYRYNSRFHQIVIDYLHPVHNINKGFLPVYQDLDPLRVKTEEQISDVVQREIQLDSLKVRFLSEMIQDVGNTNFVFVYSPTWYGTHYPSLDLVRKFARENNVDFIDFSTNEKYVRHDDFFYDGYHMNARGADEFTRDLMSELRERHLL